MDSIHLRHYLACSMAFRVAAKFHRVMAIVCSCSEAVPVWVLALDDSSDGNSSIRSSTLPANWEQVGSLPSLPNCAMSATSEQELMLM